MQLESAPHVRPCPTRFVGPNQLMEETIQLFLDPRYGVKPSQVHVWPCEPRLLCGPPSLICGAAMVVAEAQQTSGAVILCSFLPVAPTPGSGQDP